MDALSFISSPSAGVAPEGIAADAPWPDGTAAGIDFAALLALGLSAITEDRSAPGAHEEISPETAPPPAAQDAQRPALELTAALPQQPLVLDVPERVDVAPAAIELPAAKAVMTAASPGATIDSARASTDAGNGNAAAVAAGTANIAARADEADATHASARPAQTPEQHSEPGADPIANAAVESLRADATEAPSRPVPAPLAHAVQIHPLESRAPASQPSALLAVTAPVSEPGFADALSRQVVWMVDKDAQIAELKIDPPELGPVEVRLTLRQDSAAAEFVSPHAEVRAAIENAIVRLREALADAGIQLGEASVSAESFSERAGGDQREPRQTRDGYAGASATADARHPAGRSSIAQRGLVDVYA